MIDDVEASEFGQGGERGLACGYLVATTMVLLLLDANLQNLSAVVDVLLSSLAFVVPFAFGVYLRHVRGFRSPARFPVDCLRGVAAGLAMWGVVAGFWSLLASSQLHVAVLQEYAFAWNLLAAFVAGWFAIVFWPARKT